MHFTRQQRRLFYLVAAFFLMSRNFSSFIYSLVPQGASYIVLLSLLGLMGLGLYVRQDDLPWQLPLFFTGLKVIPLLPLEKVCRNNLSYFTLGFMIIYSVIFLFVFKREAIKNVFGGEIMAKVQGVTFVSNWFQASMLFIVVYSFWSLLRGPFARQRPPSISGGIFIYAFLMAVYLSLAIYSIPIGLLRGKIDKEELTVGLALGFGLFENYFLSGSFYTSLFMLILGWFFARASYETRGSLLTTLMLFVYLLGKLI